jgi:hypothetical protein
MNPQRLRRSDSGIGLVELMVSITMLGVMVMGLTTVLIVQARQSAQDKVLNDLYFYSDMVMDEVLADFGAASLLERGTNSGGRVYQDLEFNILGTANIGRKLESQFTRDGERKVIVRNNNVRPAFVDQFPPPELDPDKNRNLRYRVRVKDFRIRNYQDRQFVNPLVGNILSEVLLVLELEDVKQDYKVQRSFRRVITTPNKHIAESRVLASGQGD